MVLGRFLAGRLASVADEIADTFGRLAFVHEEIAKTDSARAADARNRAERERSVEREEREAAQWFRALESRPVEIDLPGQEGRLPSQ